MDSAINSSDVVVDKSTPGMPWMVLFFVSLGALLMRILFLHRSNADLGDHFLLWLDDIRNVGFWAAISRPFSAYGYTPFYSYCIGLANVLLPAGTDGKLVIKSVSIFFDYIAAGLVFGIVRQLGNTHRRALWGFAALLFAPTVILNGACWGQSDIVYVTFLLACLFALLRNATAWAMFWFGLGVAIKLQAAWLAPFILMMVLRGRVRWWLLGLVPVAYLMMAMPAVAAGRSLLEICAIYLVQAGTQASLSYDAANLLFYLHYFLIHKELAPQLAPFVAKASLVFTALIGGCFAWRASRGKLTNDALLLTALTSVLIVPMFFPHMHNRYFFAADVFAILIAATRPSLWPIALVMQFDSVVTYISFLVPGMEKLPVPAVLSALGFTNNLQPLTGLIAVAALLNTGLLAWSWLKLRDMLQAGHESNSELTIRSSY